MFGILAPCPARTPGDLLPRWMGHFCGLCLELRDEAGQFARLTTNYDAIALSVLVEAQRPTDARTAGPCPLRGMRRQKVPTGEGPRLAATAALLLASAKLRDHVEDGDGLAARPGLAALAARAAERHRSRAAAMGSSIRLPVDRILASIDRQRSVERDFGPGAGLQELTRPTEESAAALFAHAAVLGGRPENRDPFHAAGTAFGRLAHLLDAAEDFEADARNGAWNPLAVSGLGVEGARAPTRRALQDLKAALAAASLVDASMVRLLLEGYASHAVAKVFGEPRAADRPERAGGRHGEHHGTGDGTGPPRGFWEGMCAAVGLCCSCRCCCDRAYEGPWSRRRRRGCCHQGSFDCGDCSCDC